MTKDKTGKTARTQSKKRALQKTPMLLSTTDQKKMERQIVVTSTLIKLFSEKRSLKEYLDGVVEEIKPWSGCSSIGIRVLQQDGSIPYESCLGFSHDFLESEGRLSLTKDNCACVRIMLGKPEAEELPCITKGGSFYCNDTVTLFNRLSEEELRKYRGVCVRKGYKSVAVIPIRRNETIIGAIHIADYRDGMTPFDTIEFLESITPILGEAIIRFSMEQALRAAGAYNRNLIEVSLDPLVTISSEGKISDVNTATELATGYNREEMIGTDFSDYFTDSERARVGYQLAFKEGSVRDYELGIRHRDKKVTPVLYNATVYKNETGEVLGVFAAARDMTEKVRLEQEFRQAQKLQAIGTLASGIAHDFNNIIAGIIGFTEMVLDDVLPEISLRRRLELVLKGAYRGRDLVKQIHTFSRRSEEAKKPVSMSAILDEVFHLMRAVLPSTIEIRQRISARSDIIPADQTQIHQVILNLCNNAAHAMRDKGGVLDVVVAEEDIVGNGSNPYKELKPGPYIKLIISDNGCGMEPEVLERIFDPFFTTKAPGEGSGLGLSIAHGIIKSHDGIIRVSSTPGQGTSFSIFIPKAEYGNIPEEKDAKNIRGGNESILLVDDEDLLIEMNKERLERLGYTTVGVTSGFEALDLLNKMDGRFDLVITDYTMPRMTGLELARELSRRNLGVPVIMYSGLNEPISPDKVKEAGIEEVCAKAMNKFEFAHLVRRVLDRRNGKMGE